MAAPIEQPLRHEGDEVVELVGRQTDAGISTFDLARYKGASLTMIDRHYGHLASDGREHAIQLLDSYAGADDAAVQAVLKAIVDTPGDARDDRRRRPGRSRSLYSRCEIPARAHAFVRTDGLCDSRSLSPEQEGTMGRQMNGALGVVALAAAALALCAPASAQAPGSETMAIVIVAKTTFGVRTVLGTAVNARGVLNASGKLVEVDSLPTDPDTVLRDDLVFHDGSLHLVSTTVSFDLSIDPRSCIGSLVVGSSAVIDGGTGRFANASGSFAGTLRGHALAARNPDGSCSVEQPPLVEVDKVSEVGTLSF